MFIDGVKYNKQLCIYAILHSEERMLSIGVSDLASIELKCELSEVNASKY